MLQNVSEKSRLETLVRPTLMTAERLTVLERKGMYEAEEEPRHSNMECKKHDVRKTGQYCRGSCKNRSRHLGIAEHRWPGQGHFRPSAGGLIGK